MKKFRDLSPREQQMFVYLRNYRFYKTEIEKCYPSIFSEIRQKMASWGFDESQKESYAKLDDLVEWFEGQLECA